MITAENAECTEIQKIYLDYCGADSSYSMHGGCGACAGNVYHRPCVGGFSMV
jgi:hypothetical protein